MKKIILLATALSVAFAPAAFAKGCLKGAALGAVAGHYAHGHAVKGALAGCVAGHYVAKGVAAKKAADAKKADTAVIPAPVAAVPAAH